MMWRCLSDLGGQSDLWSDVDTRRTGEGSVGARVGSDGAVWHDLRIRFLRGTTTQPQSWTSYQWLTSHLILTPEW